MLIDMLMKHRARRPACSRSTRARCSRRPTRSWRKVEDRYDLHVEVFDASSIERSLDRRRTAAGRARWRRCEQALDGVDAWITGIRARAVPHARGRPEGRVGTTPAACGSSTRSWTGRRTTCGATCTSTTCPTTRFTTRATTRSAAPRAPFPVPAATAAGQGRPRRSAGCTCEHARGIRILPGPGCGPHDLRDLPPPRARGGGDPRDPRGRRRARALRAAVLRRQGLDRAAAPGREGLPARGASRSRSCTWTRGTTSPR